MNAATFLSAVVSVLLICCVGCSARRSPSVAGTESAAKGAPAPGAERISGPYTHENLTVFLVHGPDKLKAAKYLTLGEAMEQKKVIVHETGDVNQLAIENVSDEDVYIQSGDVVKGGKQDRTIATDVIAEARGGRIPIAAFCVEQGRWRQRGSEQAGAFSSSGYMVSGGKMKLASNVHAQQGDQSRVWASVQENQTKLSRQLGREVSSADSATSFQLSMENVDRDAGAYTRALEKVASDHPDAIGWAYAVNGKVVGANVYGSSALFKKLWPKLLKSGATEAIAEKDPKATVSAPSTKDVEVFFADVQKAPAKVSPVNDRTVCNVYDHNDIVLLETSDKDAGEVVHRSYIRK